jgi:hypothetical protein
MMNRIKDESDKRRNANYVYYISRHELSNPLRHDFVAFNSNENSGTGKNSSNSRQKVTEVKQKTFKIINGHTVCDAG